MDNADALRKIPNTAAGLAQIAKEEEAFPHDRAAKAAMDDWGKRLNDWENNVNRPYMAAIQKWQTEVATAKAANRPWPPEPRHPPGATKSPDGQEGDYTTLFNGMVAPLAGFPIRGEIWYQGEANTGDKQSLYEAKLSGLIEDWRKPGAASSPSSWSVWRTMEVVRQSRRTAAGPRCAARSR